MNDVPNYRRMADVWAAKDDLPAGYVIDSHSSRDLLEENRRIARHLVKRGSLAGNEPCFRFAPKPEFEKAVESIPHFCNDCAHQGNHTPQQLSTGTPWSETRK